MCVCVCVCVSVCVTHSACKSEEIDIRESVNHPQNKKRRKSWRPKRVPKRRRFCCHLNCTCAPGGGCQLFKFLRNPKQREREKKFKKEEKDFVVPCTTYDTNKTTRARAPRELKSHTQILIKSLSLSLIFSACG